RVERVLTNEHRAVAARRHPGREARDGVRVHVEHRTDRGATQKAHGRLTVRAAQRAVTKGDGAGARAGLDHACAAAGGEATLLDGQGPLRELYPHHVVDVRVGEGDGRARTGDVEGLRLL